jgi:phasin family protein
MSQMPKGGTPAKPASATKDAAKEVGVTVTPAKAQPAVKAEATVQTEPVVKAEPMIKEAPAAKAEPAVKAQPVIKDVPVAAAEPVVTVRLETPRETKAETEVTPSYSVNETIAAASDLAAASAKAVSATITATADTVAAATAEVAETASTIKPTKPTLTQGMKTMMKSTEDFVAFGQANLEAFVKSGQIWSAGVQELTKQIATSAKASFEESVSTFKAISTAKSVKEAMDLQSTFAKAALEKAMAESNKLTDASIKLTEQTLAPITARVTVAVETFGKAA